MMKNWLEKIKWLLPKSEALPMDANITFTPRNNGDENPNVVDFEEDDIDNPRNWSTWRKWSIVLCVVAMSMFGNFGTVVIVPAAPEVLQEFRIVKQIYATILVSIWELGEGFGPFFIAPLSEIYGRMPLYHIGNILFILCLIAFALSTNMAMLVVFRFLNGVVATSLTLGPSIIGDLFKKEVRGTAMSLALCMPLIGPFAAPIVGGFVAQAKGWRWTIWVVAIAVGAITIIALAVFKETYPVVILKRKCERQQKLTGNNSLRSKYQDATDKVTFTMSVTRPLQMLFFSPVVFLASFYTALTYDLSYLILTTLTEVMQSTYGFSQGLVGLTFLGRAIGNVLAMAVYGMFSDRYIKYKQAATTDGQWKPGHRLPLMIPAAICVPVGFFIYGWTTAAHVQWIVPLIGTALVGFSMILTMLPTQNYLIDIYDIYGASAVAVSVIMSAVFGALLPLVGPPLYSQLGLGWGNSVLAFIAIAFSPMVVFLIRNSEQMRRNERFV